MMQIKQLTQHAVTILVGAFKAISWHDKSRKAFEGYLAEQNEGKRSVWVAYASRRVFARD